jgi:2-C-methyl-D-erythritol 4-phosphate cytidylyltransferase
MTMFEVILVMAGSGRRAGLPYNKNLHIIKDKPLFRYALETFLSLPQCRRVIIVAAERDIPKVSVALDDIPDDKIKIIAGGATRRESVYRGLLLTESEIVLIHDAARPLVREEHIIAVYEAARESGLSALAVKATDTVYRVRGNEVELLDRDELWLMQTPQGVRRSDLLSAYAAGAADWTGITDDVGIVMKKTGLRPIFIEGTPGNIKVTYAKDLRFVAYMIERGQYGI